MRSKLRFRRIGSVFSPRSNGSSPPQTCTGYPLTSRGSFRPASERSNSTSNIIMFQYDSRSAPQDRHSEGEARMKLRCVFWWRQALPPYRRARRKVQFNTMQSSSSSRHSMAHNGSWMTRLQPSETRTTARHQKSTTFRSATWVSRSKKSVVTVIRRGRSGHRSRVRFGQNLNGYLYGRKHHFRTGPDRFSGHRVS